MCYYPSLLIMAVTLARSPTGSHSSSIGVQTGKKRPFVEDATELYNHRRLCTIELGEATPIWAYNLPLMHSSIPGKIRAAHCRLHKDSSSERHLHPCPTFFLSVGSLPQGYFSSFCSLYDPPICFVCSGKNPEIYPIFDAPLHFLAVILQR